jgi:glucose/arabinose dehydrogenase
MATSRLHKRDRLVLLLLILTLLLPIFLQDCRSRRSTSSISTLSIPTISLVLAASGFTQPLGITNAGDGSGRLFIVEQGGLVRILKNGTVLPTPFLDVSSRLKSGLGEQGLLGIAFPPGYGTTASTLYTNYTGTPGIGDTVISRFTTSSDPDFADPSSEEVLLTVVQPFANHNGGQLAFGPDGYLYIGMGDGGSGGDPFNNAQNTLSLLGKMLRIDVRTQPSGYTVPPGNPFVGNMSYLPEIWAVGLRNPWRFSFDRQTGDLFIADVGQGAYEEVNYQPTTAIGGANFGWNIMEGMHCYNAVSCDQTGLTLPVAEYDHTAGNCSITGGIVYRGAAIPALQGVYLYGDLCTGRIWGLRLSGSTVENRLLLETGFTISTFGEDESGSVYVADYANGSIYRIVIP